MRYHTLTTFDGCFYSVRLLSNDKIQNCFVVSRLYGMSSYVNGRDIPIYKRKYFLNDMENKHFVQIKVNIIVRLNTYR